MERCHRSMETAVDQILLTLCLCVPVSSAWEWATTTTTPPAKATHILCLVSGWKAETPVTCPGPPAVEMIWRTSSGKTQLHLQLCGSFFFSFLIHHRLVQTWRPLSNHQWLTSVLHRQQQSFCSALTVPDRTTLKPELFLNVSSSKNLNYQLNVMPELTVGKNEFKQFVIVLDLTTCPELILLSLMSAPVSSSSPWDLSLHKRYKYIMAGFW